MKKVKKGTDLYKQLKGIAANLPALPSENATTDSNGKKMYRVTQVVEQSFKDPKLYRQQREELKQLISEMKDKPKQMMRISKTDNKPIGVVAVNHYRRLKTIWEKAADSTQATQQTINYIGSVWERYEQLKAIYDKNNRDNATVDKVSGESMEGLEAKVEGDGTGRGTGEDQPLRSPAIGQDTPASHP